MIQQRITAASNTLSYLSLTQTASFAEALNGQVFAAKTLGLCVTVIVFIVVDAGVR